MVKCSSDELSFKKIFEQKDEERLGKIRLKFGTIDQEEKEQKDIMGIEKLVIHPDYYQYTGDTVVGHTDVALIRVTEAIFTIN